MVKPSMIATRMPIVTPMPIRSFSLFDIWDDLSVSFEVCDNDAEEKSFGRHLIDTAGAWTYLVA